MLRLWIDSDCFI